MDISAKSARLVALVETQNEIASTHPGTRRLLDLIARRAAEATVADGAMVEIADEGGLVCRSTSGICEVLLGARAGGEGSLSILCLEQGMILTCDDADDDDRVDAAVYRRIGARAMVCLPLFHKELVVGVLQVVSMRSNAFGDEDVNALKIMGGMVASSMDDALEARARQRLIEVDPVTGLGDRSSYDDFLSSEVIDAFARSAPLALVLFEVKGLSEIRSELGEIEADRVLRSAGGLLRQTREIDSLFRIADDQFALILPDTPTEGAELVARRLRNFVTAAQLHDGAVRLLYGIGLATSDDPVELHNSARRALGAKSETDPDLPLEWASEAR